MLKKQRLTILIGAGAVVNVSNVSTKSITTKILKCDNKEVIKFLKTIKKDIITRFKDKDGYKPNFEDYFHVLELLHGFYFGKRAVHEYTPIYTIISKLLDKYNTYAPIADNWDYNPTYSSTVTHVLNVIKEQIESYSDNDVTEWYANFFLELNKYYNLDIFTLNYDNWFEKIFLNYNDGFEDRNFNSEYLCFNAKRAIDLDNEVNINYLHGQIDFSYMDPLIAKKDFDDDEMHTIYKIKNSQKTERNLIGSSFKETQAGEHFLHTAIITGKSKTSKITIPPFDAYRTNLQNCLINNSNLLIIGYGFADNYINEILKQFSKIHGKHKHVNIIDHSTTKSWRYNILNPNMTEEKFRTLYGIFGDKSIQNVIRKSYKPTIDFANGNRLYLRGFKFVACKNTQDIINSYM